MARGEAPLGIVYDTDARAEPGVRIVGAFPASSHPRIVYPAAVVASSRQAQAAASLVGFMAGLDGAAMLRRFGFGPPR